MKRNKINKKVKIDEDEDTLNHKFLDWAHFFMVKTFTKNWYLKNPYL